MKRSLLTLALLLMAGIIVWSCGGCGVEFTSNPQELYSLPQLPAKYKELGEKLTEILNNGAEYAAPVGGTNTQNVQMQDLDGDGSQEAIAFFRNSADEKPLKIYIFSPVNNDSYEQVTLIEGSGTGFYSIAYSDLDQDGRMELAIGWRISTDLQVLTIYRIRPEGPIELVRTPYVRYKLTDMDENSLLEMIVLRADDEGNGIADYYYWKEQEFVPGMSAAISITMAELTQQGRVLRGTLRDGKPALYVTGIENSVNAVTDILTLRRGDLANIVLSDSTGASTEIREFQGLYPADIDNDGLTEIPCPVPLPKDSRKALFYRIDWRGYDSHGNSEILFSTYHDVEDGWYLWIPNGWRDCVSIERSTSTDEAVVNFSYISTDIKDPVIFLRIFTFSGSTRGVRAARNNRILLSRKMERTYAAELPAPDSLQWESGMTETSLREAFNLIAVEWTESEN